MSFGAYPAVPLALDRERLNEARKLLATGTDPKEQRKADRTAQLALSANSFQAIAPVARALARG